MSKQELADLAGFTCQTVTAIEHVAHGPFLILNFDLKKFLCKHEAGARVLKF